VPITGAAGSSTTVSSKCTAAAATRAVILKQGDDVRHDQLALAMLAVMRTLLLDKGLDLLLHTYAVLPTSASSGMVECVQTAVPLSAVVASGESDA
jgi:phosphatidylinositol kinase/protein kinase (PI-3  family)